MSIKDKLITISENIPKVYDAGVAQGIVEGIEQGKQEQYDAFWDVYQMNGARKDYNYAFTASGFNADTFYPKYDIIIQGYCINTFAGWIDHKQAFNFKDRLAECGVRLDTSQATNLTGLFSHGGFREIPTIDCTGLTGSPTNTMFQYNYNRLTKIEKIITKADVTYTNWFRGDTHLTEISFEGIIGQDIDLQWCPLNRASIESIMEHLSTSSSGKTITLKQTAVDNAFTSDEWETLKAAHTNWTISLI